MKFQWHSALSDHKLPHIVSTLLLCLSVTSSPLASCCDKVSAPVAIVTFLPAARDSSHSEAAGKPTEVLQARLIAAVSPLPTGENPSQTKVAIEDKMDKLVVG